MDDAAGAFDEWQWPASCGSMRQLESHLRCQICGDFFHGPVLLPCAHAFCSECVRRFLQTKGGNGCCPECKQPCAPRDLVANRPLERVVLLFQEAKPQLLGQLGQGDGQQAAAAAELAAASTRSTRSGSSSLMLARRGSGKPAERMALVSYNVMKDKEVRKLLDAIGVRVPTKSREEIIQIHKEYVLLANAQADSCDPKTAAELRDQVVRNYHLRVQEKTRQAELSKRGGANAETPAANVTAQMAHNFSKLAREIADRKAGKQPSSASASAASTPSPMTPANGKAGKSPVGIWRHIYAMDTKQEFYINSVTREIRLQPPSPRIQQQSPANRYDGITEPVVDAVSSSDAIAGATPETPGVLLEREGKVFRSTPSKKLPHTRVKRAIADDFFSPGSSSAGESASPHGRSRLSMSSSAASVATTETTVVEEGETKVTVRTTTTTTSAAAAAVVGVSEDGDAVGGNTPETAISVHGDEERQGSSSTSAAAAGEADDDEGKRWSCPRCTLVNDPTCVDCEACGYENTALQPPRKRQRKKMQFQSKLSLR